MRNVYAATGRATRKNPMKSPTKIFKSPSLLSVFSYSFDKPQKASVNGEATAMVIEPTNESTTVIMIGTKMKANKRITMASRLNYSKAVQQSILVLPLVKKSPKLYTLGGG